MNNDRNIYLVTGAAGWIGRQVRQQLEKAGCITAGFDRVNCGGLAYVGELGCLSAPPVELAALLQKTCAVVHCAGRAHRPVETLQEIAIFEQTNVRGTQDLVSACHHAGIRRIVYVSTIAAYDWEQSGTDGVLEDGKMASATAYASTKLKGERLVRESGLDYRVARLATVFGVGDKANFAKLALSLKRRRFVVPGVGDARKSVIPVDLAAVILARLAMKEDPKHRLMNVALADPPTLRELCDGFSQVCGFERAHSVPVCILRGSAVAGGVISKLWPGFPLTTSTLNKLVTSTVVNNRRLRETFPDLLMPSFSEALGRSAEYYRNLN